MSIPWGAPLSKTITEKICQDSTFVSVKGEPLGQWFYTKLIDFYKTDPESVNFETILHSIELLCGHYESSIFDAYSKFKGQTPIFLQGNRSLDEILDFENIYTRFHNSGSWHVNILTSKFNFNGFWNNEAVFFETVYLAFINIIVSEIEKYESFCLAPQFKKLNNELEEFLTDLNKNHIIRSYTLNYDRLLPLISKINFFEGFTSDDLINYHLHKEKILKDNNCNCFYNLHGSIHFNWENFYEISFHKDKFIYSSPGSPLLNDQSGQKIISSNILTGLNKTTRLLRDPYSQFHHTFYNDCLNAEKIYVIGYSFSDYHINNILKESLQYKINQEVIVIDHNLLPGEIGNITSVNDLFYLDERAREAFLSHNQKLYNIASVKTSGRILYYRKGLNLYLENKVWKLVYDKSNKAKF